MELVSKYDAYNRAKHKPVKGLSVDFQGRPLAPCVLLTYWYRWGEYTFDIRELRKARGKKPERPIDLNWKMHPYTHFQRMASEIIWLVGSDSFLDVLKPT